MVAAIAGGTHSTSAQGETCPPYVEEKIIDAAIGFYVSLGIQTRELIKKGACNIVDWDPDKPCVNTSPYFSIEQLREQNPNCCEVLKSVPGDYSENTQKHLRGEKHPKMYLVDMNFTRVDPKGDSPTKYQFHAIKIVDCFGNVQGQRFPPPGLLPKQ